MSVNALTERYVREVVRRIPADQRDDVADELRTTIADTVDAREAAGAEAAEREVLTEMGDPIRLAARYADRPLAVIGPEFYPAYVRLLKVLLTTVLPVVVIAIAVIEGIESNRVGAAIGAGIGAVFTVGAQMIAWLTVVFALIERSGHRPELATGTGQWTPDDLPDPKQSEPAGLAASASALWHGLLIGAISWQHTAKPFHAEGDQRIEVLNPDLWSGWIWPLLLGLAGLLVVDLLRVTGRSWTLRLVGWYAAAQVLFAGTLALICLRHDLLNPAFLAEVNVESTPATFYTAVGLGALIIAAYETLKAYRATSKA